MSISFANEPNTNYPKSGLNTKQFEEFRISQVQNGVKTIDNVPKSHNSKTIFNIHGSVITTDWKMYHMAYIRSNQLKHNKKN